MITIQEILGTDSVAASRLSINSNFLLIENEINDLEDTFNINVVTGSMDMSQATSGQLKSKTFLSNQATFPASGTPAVSIYGTGASAGNASFSGIISASQLVLSGTGSFNQVNASGPAVFDGDVTINGDVTSNSSFVNGPTGTLVEKNSVGASGSTNPFLSPSNGGGGVTGTFSNPYALSFTESLIYANCSYVSTDPADASNSTGFFFYVATGTAPSGNPPSLPQGYKLTVVNTGLNAGLIATGVTGPGGSTYYTGFNNSGNGLYQSAGITTPANIPYKSTLNLQWENRIGKGAASQNGSWVVISNSGFVAANF